MTLADRIGAATGARVVGVRGVPGGDINDGYAITLDGGRELFVKTRAGAPPGEYADEAASLRWLGEAIAVPEVIAVDDEFLALEFIHTGPLGADGEERLGRELAAMHALGAPAFGHTPGGGPMRLGAVELPSEPCATWPEFYARRRLEPLARSAGLSADGRAAVDRVCERIDELCGPAEPPARLHGDLWSGNVLTSTDGIAHLIDPAAYGGHREVDLAMLRLFGTIPARTWAAYQEAAPLADGHERRLDLYQLLPLLVHAALFGGAYVGRAEACAQAALSR